MKRENENTDEPSKLVKQSQEEYKSDAEDHDGQPVTEEALWNAAYNAAYHNQPEQLTRLLTLVKNPKKLNWDHTSEDEKHPGQGATLAWKAIYLAVKEKPELLKALLESPEQLKTLNWNAAPQGEKNLNRGITSAWGALTLAVRGKPELLKALLESPEQLEILNWNAAPQDEKSPDRGLTLTKRFAGLFEQNIPFYEPLIHSWSLPVLFPLRAALTDEPKSLLFRYVDFLIKLDQFHQPAETVIGLDEDAKSSGAHFFDDYLQSLQTESPDLYSSSCFYLAKEFPLFSLTFYDKIAGNHRYYAEAQYELASRHFFESKPGEEKGRSPFNPSPDSQRQSHLASAFRHACRYWHTQAEAKTNDCDIRVLLKRIVTAILLKDPEQHSVTTVLPSSIESMLETFAKTFGRPGGQAKTFGTPEGQSQLELNIENLLLGIEMHTLKTDNNSLQSQVDTLSQELDSLSQRLNQLTSGLPTLHSTRVTDTAGVPEPSPHTGGFFKAVTSAPGPLSTLPALKPPSVS